MKIKSLKLNNYRNYDYLSLDFAEDTNIFYGNNAQGKTNILESIYLCGTTKSHKGTKDRDLIKFGEDEAHVKLKLEKKEVPYEIDIHLKKNHTKGIAVNRIPIKKARELFGVLNVVLFSPEDMDIIKSSPSYRRRFMDMELAQLDRVYISYLMKYNHIINQRNHLLKQFMDEKKKKNCEETLEIWDIKLIEYGNEIIERRKQFIKEINEIVSNIHKKLTGNKETMILVYEPSTGDTDFKKALVNNRDKDIRMKNTSVGPHRDDICFLVNDLDIRKYGSQGQQRTAALSLKLSEIELVKRKVNDPPVLLLDDVLSELDQYRQNYLLKSIENVQTFITCTGVEDFLHHNYSMNHIYHVKNGEVVNQS